ncbi:hypothetical protein KY495_16825 [Massilia sp. PAMC28688]|uniref:hypothetical protein n=1 Tax=Massilia sp. PAMC28688 TaxID=2861283 RepID=UPI001C63AABF|nr:hypothetical protein [Massilia sp. PAMC28688]QYF92405.1 hypothetical protein KY495_16825 [Massilia sp. PAMC28688]
MKALLLLAAVFWLDDASAARTLFQVRCEETMQPAVSVVTTRQNGYTVNNTYSYHDITAFKGRAPRNAYVLGLTRTESQMDLTINGSLLQDRLSGYECISPQITVALKYAPIIIYIGREFKPGTCSYDEILAHEMRHLKTYLEHLPKVESVVRKALADRFNNKPLYAMAGQARAALQREIDTGWVPYIKRELRQVEIAQARIDTPQEYARLSRVCKGEVQSLIGPAKRARR